ncbi:TetR/AcrR family transcriptional regulator [Dysgonomonas sp. Marseille-P4677]|uniref:TetR/AcrR family transcriptional regulator n=1 Tax=Dysgonomonas sp. Marseille-P4677 TaxID=2364790 RepID=UPI0019130FBA|nr:TetR/AcrR family transcriptional regulator [Dysgonomonas sp. Marseille-P4677]MBK5723015.1 TetR/AcrR family transcriptional regulator [Dysgonomonas sp. Marseille-P4677]
MKYSREFIIRRAFDVFMNNGYDSTSITILQKELNMSRGAMYRYFKNKEDLFIAVIDEYFFKLYNRILENLGNDLTVPQLLDKLHRRNKLIANAFTRVGITHTVFLNYTALVIQAAKHYPNFLIRFQEINSRLLMLWKSALLKSIEMKQIQENIDVDIMSVIFNNINTKESSNNDCDESKFVINVLREIERKRQIMDYLYNLIRI